MNKYIFSAEEYKKLIKRIKAMSPNAAQALGQYKHDLIGSISLRDVIDGHWLYKQRADCFLYAAYRLSRSISESPEQALNGYQCLTPEVRTKLFNLCGGKRIVPNTPIAACRSDITRKDIKFNWKIIHSNIEKIALANGWTKYNGDMPNLSIDEVLSIQMVRVGMGSEGPATHYYIGNYLDLSWFETGDTLYYRIMKKEVK